MRKRQVSQETIEYRSEGRSAGMTLAGAALVSILAMAHHPSGPSGLAQPVHGAMMLVVIATLAGFAWFAARRGLSRFAVLAGLVAYAAGAVANLLAAAINGFVAPALAGGDISADIFRLCWELNQALAYGAVYAASIAFVLWGGDMLLTKKQPQRLLGLAGLAAGLVPAALLAGRAIEMDVAGAFIVYAMQAAFAVSIGLYLMRSKE